MDFDLVVAKDKESSVKAKSRLLVQVHSKLFSNLVNHSLNFYIDGDDLYVIKSNFSIFLTIYINI